MKNTLSTFIKLIGRKFMPFMMFVCLLLYPIQSAYSAGPTEAVGPIDTTGITEPTGPTQATGVIEPNGITEPTGPNQLSQVAIELDSQPSNNTEINSSPAATSTQPSFQTSIDGGYPEALISETSRIVNDEQSNQISVENDANINNMQVLNLNSGNNILGSNTAAGNLITGDISAILTFLNVANSTFAPGSRLTSESLAGSLGDLILDQNSFGSTSFDLANNKTGESSNNINILETADTGYEIVVKNDSDVLNNIEIVADTGHNTVNNNTIVGDILTGNIDLGVNIINLLNLNNPGLLLSLFIYNILGDQNGNIIIAGDNSQTGSDSQNQNLIGINNTKYSNINQDSNLINDSNVSLNSGNNFIGQNTLSKDISTGNIDYRLNLTDLANIFTTKYYLLNVFGEWDGILPQGVDPNHLYVNVINSQTGSESTNMNDFQTSNQNSLELQNYASAENRAKLYANTGENNISNNTKIGNITTGDINLTQNIVNVLNSFGDQINKFALSIINIFGNWKKQPADGKGGGGNQNPPPSEPAEETLPDGLPVNNQGQFNAVNQMSKNSGPYLSILPETGSIQNRDQNIDLRTQPSFANDIGNEFIYYLIYLGLTLIYASIIAIIASLIIFNQREKLEKNHDFRLNIRRFRY